MKGLTPSRFDAFKGALAGTFYVPSASIAGEAGQTCPLRNLERPTGWNLS